MSWASWTTTGVYTGGGGVLTDEVGVLTGDVTVHTTFVDGEARVAVQYSGASDWFTMSGSPVPCGSEPESRDLHDAVVEAVREAVREGGGAIVPSMPHLSG
ncbi:hypothetical protein ABZ990_20370 [Streptomyces sp. NPDC046203]|uniref:hypothetical protein n=1 Tax=Streptomyces sp. NPDC046203 TaxID=3154602 RepID=UPI0033F75A54